MTQLGYPIARGLAAVCISSLTPIICKNVEEDARYYQPLDDPDADELAKAKSLIAVPIIGEMTKDANGEKMPRGVVIAINKEDNTEFTNEDIDMITLYNNIATKVFDVMT